MYSGTVPYIRTVPHIGHYWDKCPTIGIVLTIDIDGWQLCYSNIHTWLIVAGYVRICSTALGGCMNIDNVS